MDRVKKYDKYTVLSELNRLIGQNAQIKGTYVKTLKHDDIFETNVNKTTELHAIKSGNKRVYVPIVKDEPVQEGSISERQLLKLLQNVKNPSAQRILREYMAQNKDIDKEMMSDRIISRTVQATNKMKKQMNDEDKEIFKMIMGNNKPTSAMLEFIEGKYEGNEMSEIIERIKRAKREGNAEDLAYYKRKAQELTGNFLNKKKEVKPLLALTYRDEDKPKLVSDSDNDEPDTFTPQARAEEDEVVVEEMIEDPEEIKDKRDAFIQKVKDEFSKFKTVKRFDKFLNENGIIDLQMTLIRNGLKGLVSGMTNTLNRMRDRIELAERNEEARKYREEQEAKSSAVMTVSSKKKKSDAETKAINDILKKNGLKPLEEIHEDDTAEEVFRKMNSNASKFAKARLLQGSK